MKKHGGPKGNEPSWVVARPQARRGKGPRNSKDGISVIHKKIVPSRKKTSREYEPKVICSLHLGVKEVVAGGTPGKRYHA